MVLNHLASDIHVLTKLDAKYLNKSKTREYLSLLKSKEWMWDVLLFFLTTIALFTVSEFKNNRML